MESSKRKRENERACGAVHRNMESCRRKPSGPESSSSQSQYGTPGPLYLRRKVFLSHSGKDKNFVRFLDDKLRQQYCDVRIVFFDEKDLPKAEPISMENILLEARGCELGVLVLSEDFFTHTPNPMRELEALVEHKVRLLPLFYKISVDDFKNSKRQKEWEMRWKEWSVVDDTKIQKWRHALNLVATYSGLEYCKLATNDLDYINTIVKAVTDIICPAIPFSEEGICGSDRLCEIVDNMYTRRASMRPSDGCTQVSLRCASDGHKEDSDDTLDLVGIYGFAGLGKTTLCKCLCDFYFAEFHGKVCWIDLGSLPLDQTSPQGYSTSAYITRMQHVLSKLVGPIDGVHSLIPSQVENLFKKQISFRMEPVFLAIDNILPDEESLDEVRFYLSCKFSKASKIFLTSRNEGILRFVTRKFTRFSVVIEPIPKLLVKEAMGIFVHKISNSQILDAKVEVEKCVEVCIIYKNYKGSDYHSEYWYHPLMLISLATSLYYDERHGKDWKSKVRELQSDAIVKEGNALKKLFSILNVTYTALNEEEQKVFLDLALFWRTFSRPYSYWPLTSFEGIYGWIHGFYSHLGKKRVDEILLKLADFSFINSRGWDDFLNFSMNDVMVEFSNYKLSQGAAGFNPHYLVLEGGAHLQNNPTFRFLLADGISADKPSCPPKNVRTVSISGCPLSEQGGQVELDFRNLEGVQMLHLVDNPGLQEVLLSPTTIASVRSLIVKVPRATTSSLRCIMDEGWSTLPSTASQGQLVWVELEGNVILITRRKRRSWWSYLQSLDNSSVAAYVFDLGFWPCLRNLRYLSLSDFPLTQSISLTTITQLKTLRLEHLPSLREIHGMERLTNLEMLSVSDCDELMVLTIPANLRLSSFIKYCKSLQRVSLRYTMTYPETDCNYDRLQIDSCSAFRSVDGITQYSGCFTYIGDGKNTREGSMQEGLRELLGSSKVTATVVWLELDGYLLRQLYVRDVQHIGFLISALMLKIQATGLNSLYITCTEEDFKDAAYWWNGDYTDVRNIYDMPKNYGDFSFKCRPQVRDLASLTQLGHWISTLVLEGCWSVEVWPDFGTMTSLKALSLKHTSLKEFPAKLLLLPSLQVLLIQCCWQLPVEEMIKAITCKDLGYNCACGGCLGYNCACGSGSLKSLSEDLRLNRRDRGSVVDVLDAEWPHLVTIFHKQWQYLDDEVRGKQIRFLIRVMHILWFGKCEHSDSKRHPSPFMTNMKRLLCSETLMSLVLNSEAKLNFECAETRMAVELIGSASIGCINASLTEDLKDKIVNFVQYLLVESQPLDDTMGSRTSSHYFDLNVQGQVREAVREMVRALS